MINKGIKEVIGLAMLGEGILGMFYPEKYSLFWKVGPKPIREIMEKATENPEMAQLVYAAEAGLGFWLAMSQLNGVSDNQKRLK